MSARIWDAIGWTLFVAGAIIFSYGWHMDREPTLSVPDSRYYLCHTQILGGVLNGRA
jgi:hypothetical protein